MLKQVIEREFRSRQHRPHSTTVPSATSEAAARATLQRARVEMLRDYRQWCRDVEGIPSPAVEQERLTWALEAASLGVELPD